MSKDLIERLNDGRIDELEAVMASNYPAVECPLNHLFTEGLYIREVSIPAGSLVTSKIHKTEHPFVVSKGKALVCIDKGEWMAVEAPYTGITKPGTRRVVYVIEDMVWTTFHANPDNLTEIEEIEDLVIEKYDNPLLHDIKNIEL